MATKTKSIGLLALLGVLVIGIVLISGCIGGGPSEEKDNQTLSVDHGHVELKECHYNELLNKCVGGCNTSFAKSTCIMTVPNEKCECVHIIPNCPPNCTCMSPENGFNLGLELCNDKARACELQNGKYGLCFTCTADTLDISTGWNYNNNTVYTPGDQDVFWTVVDAPTNNGYVNIGGPAWVINASSAWANAQTGSQWISAFDTPGSNEPNINPSLPAYVFQKKICVSKNTTLTFDLNVLVDNIVNITFVNASSGNIAWIGSVSGPSYYNNFHTPNNLNKSISVGPGTYFIQAELRNDNWDSPMGLNIQGTVTGGAYSLIIPECCSTNLSSISGYKFNDSNQNGIKENTENFLDGWTIQLTDSNGNVQNSTTDSNGYYLFTNLVAGTYTISEIMQAGWSAGPTGSQQTITIGTNQAFNNINFGNIQGEKCPENCTCLNHEQATELNYTSADYCNCKKIPCELQNGKEGLCFKKPCVPIEICPKGCTCLSPEDACNESLCNNQTTLCRVLGGGLGFCFQNCACGKWGMLTLETNGNFYNILSNPNVNLGQISSGTVITANPDYYCQPNDPDLCPLTYKITVTTPGGAQETLTSWNYSLTETGCYQFMIIPLCSNNLCGGLNFTVCDTIFKCPEGCSCLTPEEAKRKNFTVLCNNQSCSSIANKWCWKSCPKSCECMTKDEADKIFNGNYIKCLNETCGMTGIYNPDKPNSEETNAQVPKYKYCYKPCKLNTRNFTVCKCDNFTGEVEHTYPSSILTNWIDVNYHNPKELGHSNLRDCDEEGNDMYWAHSFTKLSIPGCEIRSGTLEIRVHNGHYNDNLNLGFINNSNSGWSALEFQLPLAPTVPVGQIGTITLNLSNLGNNHLNLLDSINNQGFLDVIVQDDSSVDCAILNLTYCCWE